MNSKLYLTISAIVMFLYGISFVLFPAEASAPYGIPPEPHFFMEARFFGSALLALSVTSWLARDVKDWLAVRAVLIGAVVGYGISTIVLIWSTTQGLLNQLGWGSTVLNILLLLGALYCLSAGSRLAPAR
jgi:xanthine/uracil permease